MKAGGIKLVVYVAFITCLNPGGASQALELYYNNIDADLFGEGIGPNGVWTWTAGPDAIFTDAVTESGGVGGTQSFLQTTDATAAVGTSWYFVRGFGQWSVNADENNLLAGGASGSTNPARYRFSMDVNISGNNGGEGTTPLGLGISAIDGNYEAV